MLVVPVMQLAIFGYCDPHGRANLATVVYDASRTQESRELVQQFQATRNFTVVREARSYDDAIHFVDAASRTRRSSYRPTMRAS
jgi:ABC-2 type transport system permease protein